MSKALENAIPRQIARESQFLWLWKRTINYVYQCYTNKSRTDGYFFTNRARHEFSDSYSGQPSTEKPAQLLARLPGPARAPLCDRAASNSPSKLAGGHDRARRSAGWLSSNLSYSEFGRACPGKLPSRSLSDVLNKCRAKRSQTATARPACGRIDNTAEIGVS